jgi:DNA invertase Pin-like site-specific DNA recombinase
MSETNGQNLPRCFGLCRASDIKQTESVATQRQLIEMTCKALNLPEPTVLEEPPGTSGYKTKFAQRPMGQYLLHTLRKGDVLVVLRIDRVGHSMTDCYSTIETFFDRGVRIVIIKGWAGNVIDLHDPTSRLLLAIFSWISEEEARKIAERTKEGLAFRRNAGLSDGTRAFCYIQNYDAQGHEIPKGEYNRLKGCYKRNLPDVALLSQVCELLVLQKATRARGKILVDYCRERQFRDCNGKEWWNGKVYSNGRSEFTTSVSKALKKARRLAVLGKLPGDWSQIVLAITGDDPVTVRPKWQSKKRRKPTDEVPAAEMPNEQEMKIWDAEQWRSWFIASHGAAD